MNIDTMSPEWLFRICDRMHHSILLLEFERRGLSKVSHPFILFMLSDAISGTALSQHEIAEKLGVSPPTATVSIQRMERAGLLCKVADKTDLRCNRITLTADGAKLVGECKEAFDDMDRRMLEGFSDKERGVLRSMYIRMIRNLEAMGAQCPSDLKENEKL
jgi:DNA-binding MarR family transcriptional regulator